MYCGLQDLIDRFGELELVQLTDFDGYQSVNTVILDQSIADAESEINSYLRQRYALTLFINPPELVAIACDITRFRLMRDGASDAVTKRYELAVSFLKNLSSGKAVLPIEVTDITLPTTTRAALPKVSATDAVFSDQFLSRL